MKNCFAYIRVSTVKQGEHGVSLQDQRSAIEAYAVKNNMNIVEWFEERVTAAKSGRPLFTNMMKRLRKKEVGAVIIHKIDRSARNLRDWADLGDLNDAGVEFHFAVECLDLTSRGGRLAADIQAVVAADYIRNLSFEAHKGFYGRLKQGFLPLPAPIGYLDNGGGKNKTIDPQRGPIIKRAFKMYASGEYSLRTLRKEVGLTNKKGGLVSKNGWSKILNNSFYYGLIEIRKTGEVFKGSHVPLISKDLFDQVQQVLKGKSVKRDTKHDFLFAKIFTCMNCNRTLTGERQKGRVYYRCHKRDCPTKSYREDRLNDAVIELLHGCVLRKDVSPYLKLLMNKYRDATINADTDCENGLRLSIDNISAKLTRLTDAYLEGLIDEKELKSKRANYTIEKENLESQLAQIQREPQFHSYNLSKMFELAETLVQTYQTSENTQKRKLLKRVSSNFLVTPENVEFKPSEPWMTIQKTQSSLRCAPSRGNLRTIPKIADEIFEALVKHLKEQHEW